MIYNDKGNEFEWIGIDGKLHNVKIMDGENEVNLKALIDASTRTMKEKTDMCEDIYYLGIGLTQSDKLGYSFLLGWLFRSVKQSLEKNDKWKIIHTSRSISESESLDMTLKTLDFLKEQLLSKKISIKDLPSLGGKTSGPTDMFE